MRAATASAVSASTLPQQCHSRCKQVNPATYLVGGRLSRRVSAAELLEVNDAVLGGMKASIGDHDGLSYNVLLTAEFLAYVPRSRESSGPADVNALVRADDCAEARADSC